METNLTWKYHARKRPSFYYKQNDEPKPSILEHWIDIIARNISTWLNKKTKGRTALVGWGNCMLKKHTCIVCGQTFWTERVEETICDDKDCFIKYYEEVKANV